MVECGESVEKKLSQNRDLIQDAKRNIQEIYWGIIFNNTIAGSKWLNEQSFSLGRWAIGYQVAYVLYRSLNEWKPRKILELGLGQSTKIVTQYVLANEGIEHYVVEHDQKWIDFFENQYYLPDETLLVRCNLMFSDYGGFSGVRQYEGFFEKFSNKKFDLILIDGPLGGDMPHLARIDVLKLLPECLEKSFVIMMDDCNRKGEMNTFTKMQKKLEDEKVQHKTGKYKGAKELWLICSEDLEFLCTL
jgi:spermidine synthase